VSFNYLPNSTLGAYGVQDKFSIFFEEKSHKYSDKLKSSQEVFKYKEIYEYHGDIIEELVAKIYKGSQTYLDSVRASFPGLNISEKEMYRLAYGNYMDEKDHEKRPFAKLTKDIFDKLGPDLIL
jgi:outer membrane protein assembly factor BamD (BamD/ComL family)